MSSYIIHVPGRPILPAEVDERVVGLLDVDLTFALVGGHRAALHGHLTGTKLHQVFAGGAAGPRHHAGEQSSGGHDEEERLLQGGQRGGRPQTVINRHIGGVIMRVKSESGLLPRTFSTGVLVQEKIKIKC